MTGPPDDAAPTGPPARAAGLTGQLAAFAAGLELDHVPPRVVALARSQILSQLAATRESLAHDLGPRIVAALGPPLQADPKGAAASLAALTMALDFDDTVYAGHVSHSTVDVPLAYQGALGLDGRALLTAVIAANECAARVTAAATLGPFRGQTAAHTHLVGSVAARLRAEAAPPQRYVDAWGIALAMPPWSLHRAFLGSDAKVLTASVPVRTGLDACDAAAAGLAGAPDILEHPDGFLARFAAVPLPEAVTHGLGRRWHTETISFKVYPGCAYLDAAVDCAVDIHGRMGDLDPGAVAESISEVVVHAPIFTVGMDARSAPYVDGPASAVSTLNFSVAYNVATALLTGGLTPADLAPASVDRPERWALAARVRTELDLDLTRRAMLATAPLGEALREAGPRAAAWLEQAGGEAAARLAEEAGPPAPDFEGAEKAIGARVEVVLVDGRRLEARRDVPIGAAGPDTRRDHAALMRRKFRAAGGPAAAADALERIEDLGAAELGAALGAALTA